MNLNKKYEPKTIDEIILKDETMDSIIQFANSWIQGFPNLTRPALLLYGKPGTGKTLTTRCICKDADFSIIELNASSIRTKDQLKNLLKIPSYDLFGRRILLFLDEADSSTTGGEQILKKVIMQIKFPVIMAANDLYKVPKPLRDISESVQFFRPSVKALKQHLLKINIKEGLNIPIELIDSAAESQDYRMAYHILDSKQILKTKDKKMSLQDCTRNLLTKQPATFEDTKSLIYYIDENIKFYDMLDMYETFEILHNVDKYNKRGQKLFSNMLIKEIPTTTSEIEEIKYPVYYEKNKNSKKLETK
jgi:DNA polymerase III delta prime subunit